MSRRLEKLKKIDWFILIPYLALCVLGIVMVYSASSYKLMQEGLNPMHAAIMQAIFFVLSLAAIAFLYYVRLDFLKDNKAVDIIYLIILGLLLFVLLFGRSINGAKGWITIGPVQFQPMEFFKVTLIIIMARLLTERHQLSFGHRFYYIGTLCLGLLLIIAQPDTGGFLICTLIILSMWACSGESPTVILSYVLAFFAMAILAIFILSHFHMGGYRSMRFAVIANPFKYAQDSGHQLINSYYAMSNGGWFGVGLGNSIEKRGFLPEAQTDFIFAIIVEELGMITGLLAIAAILIIVIRIMYIGIRSENKFNSYLCIGIGMMLFIQMFVNLGGVIGLIPLTGVTLPFLSQGGSSLLMLSVGIGIALNVSANERGYRLKTKRKRRRVKIFEEL